MTLEQEAESDREETLTAGEAAADLQKEEGGTEDERKKPGGKRLSFFGRVNRISAAIAAVLALVLIGSGYVLVTMKPGNDIAMESAAVAEEAAVEETDEATAEDTDEMPALEEAAEIEKASESAEEATFAAAEDAETDGIADNGSAAAAEGINGREMTSETADAADAEEAGNGLSLSGGNEISAGDLMDMVSGEASRYMEGDCPASSSATTAVRMNGYNGDLYLEWKDSVVERAVWTGSDPEVSAEELRELISAEIGAEPERVVDSEAAVGISGNAEESGESGKENIEAYMYVWSAEGKRVVLRQDSVIEISME